MSRRWQNPTSASDFILFINSVTFVPSEALSFCIVSSLAFFSDIIISTSPIMVPRTLNLMLLVLLSTFWLRLLAQSQTLKRESDDTYLLSPLYVFSDLL